MSDKIFPKMEFNLLQLGKGTFLIEFYSSSVYLEYEGDLNFFMSLKENNQKIVTKLFRQLLNIYFHRKCQ